MFQPLKALFLCGLLAACAVRPSPPPLDPAEEPEGLLERIDTLEAEGRIEAAPSLALLMDAQEPDLAVRARAAGALAVFGFPKGMDFCLGVFSAGLEGFEKRDRSLSIPFTSRMAFARELAARSLGRVLEKQGMKAPFFSANFGAPDLKKAEREWRRLLRPALERRPPEGEWSRFPSSPPSSIPPGAWKRVCKELNWVQGKGT